MLLYSMVGLINFFKFEYWMLFLTLTIDIYIEVWTENSWTIIIIYLQRQRDKKWNQKCSSSFNNNIRRLWCEHVRGYCTTQNKWVHAENTHTNDVDLLCEIVVVICHHKGRGTFLHSLWPSVADHFTYPVPSFGVDVGKAWGAKRAMGWLSDPQTKLTLRFLNFLPWKTSATSSRHIKRVLVTCLSTWHAHCVS